MIREVITTRDKFSEDLDFDCKDLSESDFVTITDHVVVFLQRSGYQVETRDKPNKKLKAFRRNLFFPQFLFDLGLSGYRDERFLIKLEAQDQNFPYTPSLATITGCGFFLSLPVPPDATLCAMKLSALLNRQKGRDFYDSVFLLGLTEPDYAFLTVKQGIENKAALKTALLNLLEKVDLNQKARDCEHLLFNKQHINRILLFDKFVAGL